MQQSCNRVVGNLDIWWRDQYSQRAVSDAPVWLEVLGVVIQVHWSGLQVSSGRQQTSAGNVFQHVQQ